MPDNQPKTNTSHVYPIANAQSPGINAVSKPSVTLPLKINGAAISSIMPPESIFTKEKMNFKAPDRNDVVQGVFILDGKEITSPDDPRVMGDDQKTRKKTTDRYMAFELRKHAAILINDPDPTPHEMTSNEFFQYVIKKQSPPEEQQISSSNPNSNGPGIPIASPSNVETNQDQHTKLPNTTATTTSQDLLSSQLSDTGINLLHSDRVPDANAAALNTYLGDHPDILDKMKIQNQVDRFKEIDLDDFRVVGGLGGGALFEEPNLSISGQISSDKPDTFISYFIHELGHATLQRFLESDPTIKKLDDEIANADKEIKKIYNVNLLQTETVNNLPNLESVQGNLPSNPFGAQSSSATKKSHRMVSIKPRTNENEGREKSINVWKERIVQLNKKVILLQKQKSYFQKGAQLRPIMEGAYEIIAKYGTKYIFGTNFGKLSPEDRKTYQLDRKEFYAESFRHIYNHENDLLKFVANLTEEGAPKEVIVSWNNVMKILYEYRDTKPPIKD